jgi:hypothetical protein
VVVVSGGGAASTAMAFGVDETGRPTTETATAVLIPTAARATNAFMSPMMRVRPDPTEWLVSQNLLLSREGFPHLEVSRSGHAPRLRRVSPPRKLRSPGPPAGSSC